MDFEMDIRSGTNPGPLYANVFSTTNTGGDGYSFTFNDNNDKISLYYDGTLLTEATVTGLFTATENWQKVVINYERGMIAISLGGSRKFYYKDIEREKPYVNGEYTNFSSASTDGRKIRNLRIVNGEKWMYTGESNIAYTQGSVGIGVSDPQYTLDVGGDINLSGSFYQGGSPFVSSLWTDGGDSLYYRSNVEVGTGNLYVDTTTSRVGINTTTPGYDLDVNGDINFTGTFYQGGSPFVSSLWTSGNDSLYYTASNVGIGTDTAEYTLDVHGNANVGALTTTSVSGDGSALYGIQSSNVSDFASNVTRIETLETDLGSNVTRIETLETDLASNVTRIETLETDLTSNVTRIESIESGAHTFTGIKTFEDDVILESNLRVNGELLVANTVHMIVSDPIMELGANNLNTGDLGIIMTRHGETGNVAIVYDESQDVLNVGYTLSNAYENTITMDTANSLTLQVNNALNVGSNVVMDDVASNVIEVSGNVKTDSLFLGNFEVVASQGLSHVTAVSAATNDTVYLNNPTTGLVVDSNVEVGGNLSVEGDLEFNGNLTMNTITVQTLFTLDHVVSQGNTTANTVQFQNATTALTATGNVEVGGELSVSGDAELSSNLTVSGNATVSQELSVTGNAEVGGELSVSANVEVGTANLFVDTTTGNVGVGTTEPIAKLDVRGSIQANGRPAWPVPVAHFYKVSPGTASQTYTENITRTGRIDLDSTYLDVPGVIERYVYTNSNNLTTENTSTGGVIKFCLPGRYYVSSSMCINRQSTNNKGFGWRFNHEADLGGNFTVGSVTAGIASYGTHLPDTYTTLVPINFTYNWMVFVTSAPAYGYLWFQPSANNGTYFRFETYGDIPMAHANIFYLG
jgi:predicted acyltransferase (DUF342 family)